ncbi:MAG: ATP-binding protein [Candidatus Woesearchaeota archaeon]
MANILDVVRRMRKLSLEECKNLDSLEGHVSKKQQRLLNGLLKERKVIIEEEPFSVGGLLNDALVPKVISKSKSPDVVDIVSEINNSIRTNTEAFMFEKFSAVVHEKCASVIAPNIVGFDDVKKAVALQLFTPEHIHILLLGDPGTGKTQILSAAADLATISSMGLGSGTSGVGLAVTVKGKEVVKGLLPMADKGLCAIDELNLMKEESRASLYNAMEKGFVSYDKGGHSFKFDARISVLATANPKGDKFTATTVDGLKKQLPFDTALLSRFHLTFLVRKHDAEEFKKVTKALLQKKKQGMSPQDLAFLCSYVKRAHAIPDVRLPSRFEQEIVDFISDIKANEDKYLVEISPRMVVGFTRMVKASARMELREEVIEKDVKLVKHIVSNSLKFK